MDKSKQYHLVHIITGGEFKTPLVAVQVFDRAQAQATVSGDDKPISVSVWIIEPMRELFNSRSKEIVERLRERCPDIDIRLVGGINRLGDFPALQHLTVLRIQKGKDNVVYHCRGDVAHIWGARLTKKIRTDSTVLDVRGYWPFERLSEKDIYDHTTITGRDKELFEQDIKRLQTAVTNSEKVTTVSRPLKQYLVEHFGADADTAVVPCCVNDVIPDDSRTEIRKQLNIVDKKAILYLGGTQKYQHVEDLVIPFLKSALTLSPDNVAVFITQHLEKMQALINANDLPAERVKLLSVKQNEVGAYLTAMDVGLLLRAPSPLNDFAQPVKLGEYLSAGLPVVVERGTGEVADLLGTDDIGYAVSLYKNDEEGVLREVQKALLWAGDNSELRREKARNFVKNCYTWKVNVPLERQLYIKAIQNRPQ